MISNEKHNININIDINSNILDLKQILQHRIQIDKSLMFLYIEGNEDILLDTIKINELNNFNHVENMGEKQCLFLLINE